MATATQIVDRLDAKIYEIINDPDSIASYRFGDKQVSRVDIIRELRLMRAEYHKIAMEEPYEDIRTIAFDFDKFGREDSEWIGDATT